MRSGRLVGVVGVVILCAACGGREEAPRPAMSQRERDSAIGASRLPGAQGVRGALAAGDSAEARRRLADSIASADDQ